MGTAEDEECTTSTMVEEEVEDEHRRISTVSFSVLLPTLPPRLSSTRSIFRCCSMHMFIQC